ncbi:MAG: Si-specific NAD(P)(+) transhydrogenase [Parachlamydiales bacterium]|nr:Si-specific NAD(P)(+) transhydrogenase [Parachlamydiales bacterium]
MKKYDLVVIGSGPGGEKAATKAAHFGYKVAVIEKAKTFGGAGVNTGTLPSKTLKEAALYFSGKYDKGLYGVDRQLQHHASVEEFMYRKNFIVNTQSDSVFQNLVRHKVEVFWGEGTFIDQHTLEVKGDFGSETLVADKIIIATGSYPVHFPNIPFDNQRVHDSDSILEITRFPASICVVGAGVIGCEYATIFAAMGAKVYLVNRTEQIMPFIDKEVTDELVDQMKRDGIELIFNTSLKELHSPKTDREFLRVGLEDDVWLHVDMFLLAAGRNGNTKSLGLEKVGIPVDKRELLTVNAHFQTAVPHIYAVGDVIGFPSLANTSMDQGRLAVAHMFSTGDLDHLYTALPFGVYTIPEVSTVGISEEEAQKQGINYGIGKAYHSKMSRGKILGAEHGFLKMVYRKDDLVIIGVHIIGHMACELIHYGMTLVEDKKTVRDVIAVVFNYPTLHDLYKYAAYDALNGV